MDDEGENTVKVAKKQRANSSEEKLSTAEPESAKRGGRRRRTRRSKLEEEVNEKAKTSVQAAPIPSEEDSVIVCGDLILQEDTGKKGNKLGGPTRFLCQLSVNFWIIKQYFIHLEN